MIKLRAWKLFSFIMVLILVLGLSAVTVPSGSAKADDTVAISDITPVAGMTNLNSISLQNNQISGITHNSDTTNWQVLNTPSIGSEILSPSEVNKIAVAADGVTIWAVDTPARVIRKSSDSGLSWGEKSNSALHSAMTLAGIPENNQFIWDVVLAPDDSNIVAVVTGSATSSDPTEVWLTTNGGTDWECKTFSAVSGEAIIGDIDMSIYYGSNRDIAVGVRGGVPGAFRLWVLQIPGSNPWKLQTVVPVANADIVALKFSPRYNEDASLAVVFCTDTATYYNIAFRDILVNITICWAFSSPGVEVKSPNSPSNDSSPGVSPEAATIVNAYIELPSDFNGQHASLRRTYISLNSVGAATKSTTARDGIFRIDDAVAYVLMDSSQIPTRSICSIAFYGTYASGKLLAGEVRGFPCTATVPIWFTDAPLECPIPCWYPSLKPPTGAAAQGACAQAYGNAQVAWSPDGMLAYCGTSSADFRNGGVNTTPGSGCWPAALRTSVALDESAFSLTRNNGETWNQTGLIDTRIDKLTDVAPSADSSTIYLASINGADIPVGLCTGFDSVWRTSSNTNVTYPLLPQPIGTVWERVLTRVTGNDCGPQTNKALLRVAPYGDLTGEIVSWGAYDPTSSLARGVAAWSPDYGDYWAMITVRHPIQDFCFGYTDVLYFLNPGGLVQKMLFTGVTWSTALPDINTGLGSAYSIIAHPFGHVLVGGGTSSNYPVAYSVNGAETFTAITKPLSPGNLLVAFGNGFIDSGPIYAASYQSGSGGSIYRNSVPSYSQWTDLKPLQAGYYGLAVSPHGTLYAANQRYVERTLHPDAGNSGDASAWDVLNSGLPDTVSLTLGPNSLKLSGTGPSTDTLYVIDDAAYFPEANTGRLWINNGSPTPPPPVPPETKTYTNDEYCFSLQYPGDWVETPYRMTSPLHLAAFGVAAFVPGVIIAALDADAPMSVDWIIASFQEMGYQSPAVISPLTQTILADGTKATTYKASYIYPTGYDVVAFCLDADRCDKRIHVMVFTVEAFSPYDEALFSEIAHTLTFTCTCGQPEPPHIASVPSATGTGIVTFSTDIGTITDLTAVAEGTLPTDGKPAGVTFPHGLFSFRIIGIPPGATATVTISFPSSLPEGTQYWKYQAGIGWYQIPIISLVANVIVIRLTDGGMGDADKVVNQIIVDPGGSGLAGIISATTPPPRSSTSPPHTLQLPPADVRVHTLSVSPGQAQVGQTVTVLANLVNNSSSSGSYDVALRINGKVEQQRMVEVSPGTAYPVKFTVTKSQPGTYTVNIGDKRGSFIVLGTTSGSGQDTRGGQILVALTTVIVLLLCLMILVARRRQQGY